MCRSVRSGRIAFEQSAATFPGVSAPSSVVRSMQRIASSSANSFASRLIERLASSSARPSTATWSTEPTRGSRGSSGSSKPRGSAGACAMAPVYARAASMKNALLKVLGRMRLLAPTYRAYERVRAAKLSHAPEPASADGLPVPPPHLIMRVAGTADAAWFLESGRLAAQSIRETLRTAGTPIETLDSILDFGCGCGRVIRNWAGLEARVAGSDLSGDAIDWCRTNLSFARFETNGLSPPLVFDDASFDLTYALSVLTHLPEAIQHDWMDELHRVARPHGLALLTTHGERYLERRRFRAGELVVRWGEVPGTNLCTTFHPPSWVRERLLPHGFEEVTFLPEGAAGNPHQDLFLLRTSG